MANKDAGNWTQSLPLCGQNVMTAVSLYVILDVCECVCVLTLRHNRKLLNAIEANVKCSRKSITLSNKQCFFY